MNLPNKAWDVMKNEAKVSNVVPGLTKANFRVCLSLLDVIVDFKPEGTTVSVLGEDFQYEW